MTIRHDSDQKNPHIMGTGSDDGPKQQVASLVERLVAWIDDWTGPLSGAAIVTSLVGAILFALVSAHVLGGD